MHTERHSKDNQGWPAHIHTPEQTKGASDRSHGSMTLEQQPGPTSLLCVQTECTLTRFTSRGDRPGDYLICFLVSDPSEALDSDWSKGALETWNISGCVPWPPHSSYFQGLWDLWCLKIWSLVSWCNLQKYHRLFTRENCSDLGLSRQKVFTRRALTTLSVQNLSVAPKLSQGELLRTKSMFWVGILQLTRTG